MPCNSDCSTSRDTAEMPSCLTLIDETYASISYVVSLFNANLFENCKVGQTLVRPWYLPGRTWSSYFQIKTNAKMNHITVTSTLSVTTRLAHLSVVVTQDTLETACNVMVKWQTPY